ncbi:MAG: 50S ribosomal protein L18Ae [Candidatus Micrarchaeota archaeon]
MKFVVEGKMKVRGEFKPFVKEIEATSPSRATELCYNKLGADHKLLRTQIKIETVSELSA